MSKMAKPIWSVQDAKNRFSEVVEAAQRRPQTVTKHGRPAVVVIAADEYERLRHLEHLEALSSRVGLLDPAPIREKWAEGLTFKKSLRTRPSRTVRIS